MTDRSAFTDEEWERLGRSPLVAAMAISLADPGGPIEAVKESSAAVKTLLDAAQDGKYGSFPQVVAKDVTDKVRQHHNPMSGFKPKGATAREEILDELRAVNGLLDAKADPGDAAEFRAMLKGAAQRAADAAKEGGFMGFHAERVSEGEQKMLDTLDELFGAGPPAAAT
jgi:hypothetical protein